MPAIDPELREIRRDMRRYHERSMLAIEASNRAIDKMQVSIDRSEITVEQAREEIRLSRLEHANNRAVMRELSAEIHASIEENRRHNDAVVGP